MMRRLSRSPSSRLCSAIALLAVIALPHVASADPPVRPAGVPASLAIDAELTTIDGALADPSQVLPGETLELTFNVVSQGLSILATGVGFSVDLDSSLAGLEAVGDAEFTNCGANAAMTGTDVLTFDDISVAIGGECVVTVELSVPNQVNLDDEMIVVRAYDANASIPNPAFDIRNGTVILRAFGVDATVPTATVGGGVTVDIELFANDPPPEGTIADFSAEVDLDSGDSALSILSLAGSSGCGDPSFSVAGSVVTVTGLDYDPINASCDGTGCTTCEVTFTANLDGATSAGTYELSIDNFFVNGFDITRSVMFGYDVTAGGNGDATDGDATGDITDLSDVTDSSDVSDTVDADVPPGDVTDSDDIDVGDTMDDVDLMDSTDAGDVSDADDTIDPDVTDSDATDADATDPDVTDTVSNGDAVAEDTSTPDTSTPDASQPDAGGDDDERQPVGRFVMTGAGGADCSSVGSGAGAPLGGVALMLIGLIGVRRRQV